MASMLDLLVALWMLLSQWLWRHGQDPVTAWPSFAALLLA
jgi:hypothetical protein